MDCIWVNLKNVGPLFFKFISVYIKMSFQQVEKIILSCYVAVILNMKCSCSANYLKQRDLAPLIL